MSFDLGIWHSTRALDATAASDVYAALAEGAEPPPDAGVVDSRAVAAFLSALNTEYPDIDALDDEAIDDSPWSSGFEASDRHVLLSLRWGAPDAVVDTVVRLAAKHGLVLFDPQGGEVHLPPSLSPARKPWQFWR
jgi:hypothetical protein